MNFPDRQSKSWQRSITGCEEWSMQCKENSFERYMTPLVRPGKSY